uniref:Histone RNA hairpin-binding protein RNA-binding domain-containing protein n=1 Tax=Pseudo-nitzschia australis TaxID=44445 RepID=A0A7S4EFM2_9STRA|mmetsp:Transcript_8135/g.17531  ORF Transcript_8135/g.17531 Transcript_8135/m.17531 type:complete len:266 (+) Transcript_8135:183-980(+)
MGISAKQNNPRHNEKTSGVSGNSSSANKTRYQKVGNNSLKKIKFHSKSCEDASKQERIFHKLDPKNPREAHKVNQRQKAITKGKNTIGYDIYCRTIPKDKRQKRSMITPSTPDHTLDIPNKKWNGLMRSWRVALHRYDPVDLQESFAAAQEVATAKRQNFPQITPTGANDKTLTVKEKEIANSGLVDLVQMTPNSNSAGDYNSPSRRLELYSPTTSERNDYMEQDHATRQGGILSELDRWEAARQDNEDELQFSGGDDDSDDDLL